jgi:alkane 1-monooxygenase
MRFPLLYVSGPFTALLAITAFYGGGYWLLGLPLTIYVLLPVAEQLTGLSRWPSEHRLKSMTPGTVRLYEAMLLISAWSAVALLGWALYAAWAIPMPVWKFLLLALVIGEYSAFIGIVTAHELMHRPQAGKRRLAFLLMALTGYAHFCIEHVRGHHARVATPEDPASARRGQSFYAFLPQTLIGSFRSAWQLEAERLERAGHGRWSWHNDILRWHAFTLALMIAIGLGLGLLPLALFAIQAVLAIFGLETINYLEHYGLSREQGPDGSYERVRPQHSWNSSHVITNVNLFNLGRHSDHHALSNRPFYRLRHYDDVPQLPYGYAGTFLLSLVPPLWFRVMDRELDRFNAIRREE